MRRSCRTLHYTFFFVGVNIVILERLNLYIKFYKQQLIDELLLKDFVTLFFCWCNMGSIREPKFVDKILQTTVYD